MLQRIREQWLHRRIERTRSICVTFTGGLGAQILSTAIYQHFVERGYQTVADLSYFDNVHRIASASNKGQISYWNWEMDSYGVGRDSLATHAPDGSLQPKLHDGALKFSLAFQAMAAPSVRSRFDVKASDQQSIDYRVNELKGERYLCLHVRRGDYLNVASHLVSSSELESMASKFTGLVDRILILSDSPIGVDEFVVLRKNFPGRLHIIDSDPDPVLAHSLMRNAAVLVCSNSQFSLTAGLLSEGLVVIPKVWFGQNAAELNAAVNRVSDFAVLRK